MSSPSTTTVATSTPNGSYSQPYFPSVSVVMLRRLATSFNETMIEEGDNSEEEAKNEEEIYVEETDREGEN